MGRTRKLPSKSQIRDHWAVWLVEQDKFDSVVEVKEADHCFACGIEATTQRAHITPHVIGGPDTVENLHLLCFACHTDSEFLTGDDYYEWLRDRTLWDRLASAMMHYWGCSFAEVRDAFNGIASKRVKKFLAGKSDYARVHDAWVRRPRSLPS